VQILNNKQYEVINPKTRKKEIWSGERIRIYQITYGGQVKFPMPTKDKAVATPAVKKITKRKPKSKKL